MLFEIGIPFLGVVNASGLVVRFYVAFQANDPLDLAEADKAGRPILESGRLLPHSFPRIEPNCPYWRGIK